MGSIVGHLCVWLMPTNWPKVAKCIIFLLQKNVTCNRHLYMGGILALVMVLGVGTAFPNHKLAWSKVWDQKTTTVP